MSLSFLLALLVRDPLIIIATVVYGSFSLLVSFFDDNGEKQAGVARAWSRMLLRIAGVRVVATGLEKIRPGDSVVIAPNHESYMDTPVVLSVIPVSFRFLARRNLFDIPFLGTHLKRAGHVPVNTDNPRDALKTMGEAARIIREKRVSVLVFPEGGRSLTGLQAFREGAGYLAIRAGVPIVPVALKGTLHVLPMHSMHIKSGVVELRVGDPIPTANLTVRDRGELTEQVRAQVAALLQ